MKKKFLLPMMAFVCAIGLSFTTERSTADPIYDWVDVGLPDRVKVEEVDCGIPAEDCKGKFSEDGPQHLIYDSETSQMPKQGAGQLEDLLIRVD